MKRAGGDLVAVRNLAKRGRTMKDTKTTATKAVAALFAAAVQVARAPDNSAAERKGLRSAAKIIKALNPDDRRYVSWAATFVTTHLERTA